RSALRLFSVISVISVFGVLRVLSAFSLRFVGRRRRLRSTASQGRCSEKTREHQPGHQPQQLFLHAFF
ncbi:MAG: hypothetical protein ACLFVJ_19265, partial [Persicimonas sp.]